MHLVTTETWLLSILKADIIAAVIITAVIIAAVVITAAIIAAVIIAAVIIAAVIIAAVIIAAVIIAAVVIAAIIVAAVVIAAVIVPSLRQLNRFLWKIVKKSKWSSTNQCACEMAKYLELDCILLTLQLPSRIEGCSRNSGKENESREDGDELHCYYKGIGLEGIA
ncbi:uncharacterized protein VTP21DRAFT_2449 [Calcarisporiella thermophila]|uniref:uncharacterized protein n=1 Tax=Calcarisporiella thermophila TaxID=911321 RepID=UPI00374209B3